jgi:hypothetical protein
LKTTRGAGDFQRLHERGKSRPRASVDIAGQCILKLTPDCGGSVSTGFRAASAHRRVSRNEAVRSAARLSRACILHIPTDRHGQVAIVERDRVRARGSPLVCIHASPTCEPASVQNSRHGRFARHAGVRRYESNNIRIARD